MVAAVAEQNPTHLQTAGGSLLGCHVDQLFPASIQNGVQRNRLVGQKLGQLLVSDAEREKNKKLEKNLKICHGQFLRDTCV